jgi:VanZ family protein
LNDDSDCPRFQTLFFCRVTKFSGFLKYWLPVLFWAGVIFTASSDRHSSEHSSELLVPLLHWLFPHMSAKTTNLMVFVARKCAHLTEYGVLAILLWRVFGRFKTQLPQWSRPKVGGIMFIVFLYASSDEIHQMFVPTRSPRIHDVLIDTTGGALGLLALWTLGRLRKRW